VRSCDSLRGVTVAGGLAVIMAFCGAVELPELAELAVDPDVVAPATAGPL